MVVRVVRGPPVHTRPIDIGKFSQIGYVRPSVRGLREYALRPFGAPSYFSVRPLCAPSYPHDELCFIEFDIPNDRRRRRVGGRRRTTSSRTRESSAGIRLNIFIQLACSFSHVSFFFSSNLSLELENK